MKLEVLFPEVCNLYGDLTNVKYLAMCSKDIQVLNTSLKDMPRFVTEDVDMVYMGAMTENTQEKVINVLLPYKEKILEMIENKKVFLLTGNALEVFGEYIEKENGEKISGLGIFNTYAKQDMMHRYGGMLLGAFSKDKENIQILGFKNQFSQSYGDNTSKYFVNVEKGIGINPESKLEGICYNNVFATYLLGPLLVTNPNFTKYILRLLGLDDTLAFENENYAAFEKRIKEFENLKF